LEALPESGSAVEHRRWKRVAILGGVLLCAPVLGLIGTVAGMIMSFRRIETMKAPTPDDLAAGVNLSLLASLAGLVLGGFGAALLTIALVRLHRLRVGPQSGAGAAPWH